MKLRRATDLGRRQWAIAMLVFALFALTGFAYKPADIARAVAYVFNATEQPLKLCDVENAAQCSCKIPEPPRKPFPWENPQ